MKKMPLFKEALLRFQEALAIDPEHPLSLDGSIQRFEFVFELAWKAIQENLLTQGIEVQSPRQAFERAYALSWIDDEVLWINLLKDRNLTVHTYDHPLAQRIYGHLPQYYVALQRLYTTLESLPNAPSRL